MKKVGLSISLVHAARGSPKRPEAVGGALAADGFTGAGGLAFRDGRAVIDGLDIGTVSSTTGTLHIDCNAKATSQSVNRRRRHAVWAGRRRQTRRRRRHRYRQFIAKFGAPPNAQDFVSKLYQNVLNRPGEQSGVDFWSGVLEKHAASMADVLIAFSESNENQAQVVGSMQGGIAYTPW